MSPPSPRAKRRLMVRPRPVPPKRRVVELSACAKGSKTASSAVGRDADAGVDHVDRQALAAPRPRADPATTVTPPLSVNLMALPTRLVTICRTRDGSVRTVSGTASGALEPQPDAFLLRAHRQDLDHLADDRVRGAADLLELQPPGLDLGQIENVVDQLQQVLAARVDRVQMLAHLRFALVVAAPQQIGETRGSRSSACGSRGSCWPGTRSWRGSPPPPRPWPAQLDLLLLQLGDVVEADQHAPRRLAVGSNDGEQLTRNERSFRCAVLQAHARVALPAAFVAGTVPGIVRTA